MPSGRDDEIHNNIMWMSAIKHYSERMDFISHFLFTLENY